MIQIGDKVRFLDSVGGGIVRRFGGKDIVMVEDEDGFEIPTRISQCVVVSDEADARASGHIRPKEAPRPAKPVIPAFDIREKEGREMSHNDVATAAVRIDDAAASIRLDKPVRTAETREGNTLNVLLAFTPAEGSRLSDGRFLCYLVNDSNYWLFFTLLAPAEGASGKVECRYTGLVEPNTKLRLFSIDRSQAETLAECAVQLIAFKRGHPFTTQSPMHVDVRLNAARFYKLHAFVPNEFFDQDALLQPIVRGGRPYLPMNLDAEAISRGIREKIQATRPARKPAPPQEKEKGDIVEVDLHIDALLDTTAGMSPNDMLQYQLNTFRQVMQQYRTRRGQKIVFIHGKGEGVLRKAILDELKTRYGNCLWQDASFREYGFGATQVTIRK